MTTKKCPRCKEYKTLDSFAYDKSRKNKRQSYCQSCVSEICHIRKLDPKIKEKQAKYHTIYMRKWRKKPENKAAANLRTSNSKALRDLISNFDSVKNDRIENLFYIDKQGFIDHLTNLFEPGMSLDNYGAWHLDHKTDLGNFNLLNDAELRRANHYKNIRPMWATGPKGNLTRRKSSRIIV